MKKRVQVTESAFQAEIERLRTEIERLRAENAELGAYLKEAAQILQSVLERSQAKPKGLIAAAQAGFCSERKIDLSDILMAAFLKEEATVKEKVFKRVQKKFPKIDEQMFEELRREHAWTLDTMEIKLADLKARKNILAKGRPKGNSASQNRANERHKDIRRWFQGQKKKYPGKSLVKIIKDARENEPQVLLKDPDKYEGKATIKDIPDSAFYDTKYLEKNILKNLFE